MLENTLTSNYHMTRAPVLIWRVRMIWGPIASDARREHS